MAQLASFNIFIYRSAAYSHFFGKSSAYNTVFFALGQGLKTEYTGLIYQDKFSLILLPFLYVAFKRHFVNNHDKHSWVFDTQY